MGEELLLSPEILMHEEPGEVMIDSSGHAPSGHIPTSHAQLPFPNGELPPEISITKVMKSSAPLKVRSDILMPPGLRPVQLRPPPLVRGGAPLPRMPRMPQLRMGGPRVSQPNHPHAHRVAQQHNPLIGMMNMVNMRHRIRPPPALNGPGNGIGRPSVLARMNKPPVHHKPPPTVRAPPVVVPPPPVRPQVNGNASQESQPNPKPLPPKQEPAVSNGTSPQASEASRKSLNGVFRKLPPGIAISKLKFIRRPDGKGFMKKPMTATTAVANSVLRKVKKKKKKPFRGLSYNFNGKSVKRRFIKKSCSPSPDENASERANGPPKDPAFLAYLGIQRKDSTESMKEEATPPMVVKKGPKAKKSFRPQVGAVPRRTPSHASSSSDTSSKRRADESRGDESLDSVSSKRFCSLPSYPNVPGLKTESNDLSMESTESFEDDELLVSFDEEEEEEDELVKFSCECEKPDVILATKKPGVSYHCQAIETVGTHRIGCRNQLTSFELRRPAAKLPKQLYCDMHTKRLMAHQCCGFCGEFCSHGVVLMCRANQSTIPHFMHRTCHQASPDKHCPHCASRTQPFIVQLKLSMTKTPLHLLQHVSRMTFPKKKKNRKTDEILQREDVITYKMANGKIITSEGLPKGLETEALEKVLQALADKQTVKHTTRNMYIPTRSGDNVKLIQLLSLGYSPNQRFSEAEGGSPLHVAAAEGHVLTAHLLVQAGSELDLMDNEQNTALMIACLKGKAEVVRYLLQAGADLTLKGEDGMTCLHLATQNGHLECAHIILGQSNLPRNFINSQDEGGWTPLVWACENKHESVIRYILGRGADPLITDAEGNIALHWSALAGSKSTCELLLNYGCEVNAANAIGETPLHITLRQDHYECTVLLLMRGARTDIKNKSGQTPSECMTTKDPQTRNIVNLSSLLHSMMSSRLGQCERIVVNDITRAKESNPIQCINELDAEGEPKNYVYVAKNVVTTNVPIDRNIATLQHCKCTDKCSSEDTCHCSDLSVKSWYNMDGRLKEGFDYKEPAMIFECNEMCACNMATCHNRVLQHGITVRLQVFRAEGMGWGVRALADIPKGSFVCEYVGEIISDSEADTREDSYLFDLDNRDGETFCIDANRYGNIARFINHSCSPNLVPVKVFASHQDLRFPHIALFASRDIPKGQELGFDYGEKFWVIKHKAFTCHCASEKCKYNHSNINAFLKEYYKRTGEPMPNELANNGVTKEEKKELKKEEKKELKKVLTKVKEQNIEETIKKTEVKEQKKEQKKEKKDLSEVKEQKKEQKKEKKDLGEVKEQKKVETADRTEVKEQKNKESKVVKEQTNKEEKEVEESKVEEEKADIPKADAKQDIKPSIVSAKLTDSKTKENPAENIAKNEGHSIKEEKAKSELPEAEKTEEVGTTSLRTRTRQRKNTKSFDAKKK